MRRLHAVLEPRLLRRLKEHVEKSIAPKQETIVEVELTRTQKKYYRAIHERNVAFLRTFRSLSVGRLSAVGRSSHPAHS